MTTNNTLFINNKEVYDFYTSHNIDFEAMNIKLMDMLKKIIDGNSLNDGLADKLFKSISNIEHKFDTFESSANKYNSDLLLSLSNQLNSSRKEHIDNIKDILSSNINNISPLIKESTSSIISIINNFVPKNQENTQLPLLFQNMQSQIINETLKLTESKLTKSDITEFINQINNTWNNTQSNMSSLISATESRLESKILTNDKNTNELKYLLSNNLSSQQQTNNDITLMLKKFDNSSSKGAISEIIMYNVVLELFPSAQVDYVSDQKETGDIILIRNDKPKILIENKDHTTKNVPKQEIDKFIRDCEIQNCCGILFAQHKGIANKQNYELQVNNRNVLLYVHEVNFDINKIKMAIDIVENFKIKLDEISIDNNDYVIEKNTLEDINKDFVNYTNQKCSLLKIVKDFNDNINKSITDLKLPSLEKYLSTKFAMSSNQSSDNVCKYCEKYVPKSMPQHYRYCTAKQEFDIKAISTISNVINTTVPTQETIDVAIIY